MASTYSPLLRIQLMGTGDQVGTWGDTTNVNLGTLIEQAIAGTATFSVTGGDVTLTDINGVSDQARCMALRITGSPSPGTTPNIIAPYTSGLTTAPPNQPVSKFYIIANGATSSVVIKTAIPVISNGSFVVGCQYRIVSTGTTSNAEWNTIAGTSGVTYSNGSVFTATIAGTGTGNGTAEPAGVTVPSGEVYLVYFDTTFNNFRLVGRSATSANTPNTLVLRDASGNFAAGTITATTLNATTVTATNLNGQVNGNLAAGITATTPSTGDDTPKVATTAFVQNSIDPLVGPLSGGISGLKTVSGDYNIVTIAGAVVTIPTPTVTTQTCEFNNGATTIKLRVPNSNIKAGQRVTGANIPNQTFVASTGTAIDIAGSFIAGVQYTIVSLGTTDFTLIGAASNTIGTVFVASGAGTGTGTAYVYTATLSQATSGIGTNTTLTFTNMPAANTQIIFKTTGVLPTGLSPNTVYFVVSPDPAAATFSVALTSGGTAITTSGSQSGTHSFTKLSTSGSLELAGTLGVGFGGTGTNSLKPNNLLVGNGTSTVQVIPAGATNNTLVSTATSTVNAGSFVIGTEYTIASLGSPTATDFTAIGAASNTVGVVFTATGVGSGNGTATTNVWQSGIFTPPALSTAVGAAPSYSARAWTIFGGTALRTISGTWTGTWAVANTSSTVTLTITSGDLTTAELPVGARAWIAFNSGTGNPVPAVYSVNTIVSGTVFTVLANSTTVGTKNGSFTITYLDYGDGANIASVVSAAAASTTNFIINFATPMSSSGYATLATGSYLITIDITPAPDEFSTVINSATQLTTAGAQCCIAIFR